MKLSEHNKLVLIGASTGGPGQVQKIISALPVLHKTTVIVAQHMVKDFLPSFAERLSTLSMNKAKMGVDKESIQNNTIYICCGQTKIIKQYSEYVFVQRPPSSNEYNPDINSIFKSFVPFTKELNILSVILTGIGEDGVDGCKELSEHGARTIAESHKSAIVDGMPSRARALITNIEVLDLEDIINAVKEFVND